MPARPHSSITARHMLCGKRHECHVTRLRYGAQARVARETVDVGVLWIDGVDLAFVAELGEEADRLTADARQVVRGAYDCDTAGIQKACEIRFFQAMFLVAQGLLTPSPRARTASGETSRVSSEGFSGALALPAQSGDFRAAIVEHCHIPVRARSCESSRWGRPPTSRCAAFRRDTPEKRSGLPCSLILPGRSRSTI